MTELPAPDSTPTPLTTRGVDSITARPRRLSWRKKLFFSLLSTAIVLIAVELLLATMGIEPQYLSADPFVGFRPGVPLFVQDGDLYTTHPSKRMFFNDQSFSVTKSRGTYRIFCMGGSTTFGHPYDDGTSFVGWLRARLQDAEPDRNWEVINCGGISYASYRISRLMQELNQFQPDMYIFYEGHNEFLEERTYGDFKRRSMVIRGADLLVTRTRIGTALASIMGRTPTEQKPMLSPEVDTILENSVGPEKYHRDLAWRSAVIRHFQESLQRACGVARAAGAKMVIVKPASNVRSFTPFKSEHGISDPSALERWRSLVETGRAEYAAGHLDAAAANFVAAAAQDPQHAMTQWEAGNALFLSNKVQESLPYFQRAIDEDVCPLRAVSEILTAVETVARDQRFPLIDFPRIVEDQIQQSAGHRILGDESFLDHVHPTIENNRRLGWALYDELVAQGIVRPVPSSDEIIQRISTKVLQHQDTARQAMALIQVAQVLSWSGKNAEAMKPLEQAEQLFPGLSYVEFYKGQVLEKQGEWERAFACFEEAVRRNPNDFFALAELARSHWLRQNITAAQTSYERAIQNVTDAAPVSFRADLHIGLGATLAAQDRWDEAEAEYHKALQILPGSHEALARLESLKNRK